MSAGMYRNRVTAEIRPADARYENGERVYPREVWSFVYFARPPKGHYIKIGKTIDPTARLRPWCLEILALIPASSDSRLESQMHRRFSHLHFEGEWFEPGEDLLEYIASLHPDSGEETAEEFEMVGLA